MDEERNELMEKVGQLTIENDWLQKKYGQVLGSDWETKSGYKKWQIIGYQAVTVAWN